MPLTLLLPVFVLAGAGALLARLGWLRAGWPAALTELTARLLIPALLFTSTYRTGFPEAVSWQVLYAFYAPLIGIFIVLARRRGMHGAASALTSVYSNTVFVGIPVLLNVFGEASLQFAYPIIAFHSLVAFTLYYLASSAGQGATRVVRSLASAVKNPIVVSLFAGLLLNLAAVSLPEPLLRPLDMLAGAALPCALLALGASLASLRMHHWGAPVAASAVKLLLLPLCVLGASRGIGIPAQAQAVLVILAACPVGVNAAFVIAADGQDTAAVHSAILLSSLASLLTLPAWLQVLALINPA